VTTDATPNNSNPKSFEAALTELEDIVAELEEGNLTLDASVDRFRKASDLAEYCKTMITEARLRVIELQAAQPGGTRFDGAGDEIPS
jgi:exodeoxyribonuclease VII small subunit